MQERFPGAAQGGNDGGDDAGVICLGRVDDRVGFACSLRDHRRIVEAAEDGPHAAGLDLLRAGFGAHQTVDGMSLAQQSLGHGPADIARRPCQEDIHRRPIEYVG